MPVVPSDLAQGWSTRFETLFLLQYNQSIAVDMARLRSILLEMPMGNFQGNKITLDWLGAAPQMRKWLDEKRAQALNKYEYSVQVTPYEATIEIDLNAFRDARGNVYEPRIQEMAQNGARLPYNLISDLIINGTTATCYDGQYFFDTDHSEGSSGTQSNLLTGTGTSQAQITADYYAAKSALMGFKDDKGVPWAPSDFKPMVWIPNNPALIQVFQTLQGATLISNTSNVLVNAFDLVVDPRQTDTNDWEMFRTDVVQKPFIFVDREAVHYEDNFGTGHPDVWSRRIGEASAVGRATGAYGLWQAAVRVTN